MRTILVHLNIEIEDNDHRSVDEIASQVLASARISLYGRTLIGNHLTVTAPLAEEV